MISPNDPAALVAVAGEEPLLEGQQPRLANVDLEKIWIDWWFDDPYAWLDFWAGHPGCI